jgi:CheY-like chemotaxis protein
MAESDNGIPVVLLVEDNPDHAELVVRAISEHDVAARVVHVADGEAALDYLLRRRNYADPETSPRPRLILLDLRLPRVDGLEVLRAVKESPELRTVPVVVLSTSEASVDLARAHDWHANSYVVKPVGYEPFGRLMRDLAAFWLGWDVRPRP